tara:strand:+ start:84333 stop:84443 length:111 start_codon:yes stop_codon:yes gene_type:complete
MNTKKQNLRKINKKFILENESKVNENDLNEILKLFN